MRIAVVLLLLPIAGCLSGAPEPVTRIDITDFGIPHITASDYYGVGVGAGYMQAEHNLCLLAEEYVTVNGERARWFGRGNFTLSSNGQAYSNIESDTFFRVMFDPAMPAKLAAKSSLAQDQRAMDGALGFVTGYNRYLDELPGLAGRHEACRDAPWLRPIALDDMERRGVKLQLLASSYFFAPYMVDASPAPGIGKTPGILPNSDHLMMGSNGYAFGAKATANGAGMLLGNPHFPWNGPERFTQLHTTIPGVVDVMGTSLLGLPFVLIGFNDNLAWTHTVSTGWRFTPYELQLVPGDPFQYTVDGARKQILTISVQVDVLEAQGQVHAETHVIHFSEQGPIIEFPLDSQFPGFPTSGEVGMAWDNVHAYAIRDANARNDRILSQFIDIATAESVVELEAILDDSGGIPWVNTVAADRGGRAFYADISATPNVSDALWDDCNVAVGVALTAAARLPVLDGSRSACDWPDDSAARMEGLLPTKAMPRIMSSNWLINSNDSHWLPNPDTPLQGFPRIIGDEETERSQRTRMGYLQIEERLAGRATCDTPGPCDLYTLDALQQQLMSARMYSAELILDDVLQETCLLPSAISTSGVIVNIGPACQVLANSKRTAAIEDVGATLFERFWRLTPRNWDTPFSTSDPAGTPRGFIGQDLRVASALADAILEMEAAGLALGDVNGASRNTQRNGDTIPLPGGAGWAGAAAMIQYTWDGGYGEPTHGNSYVQTVTWEGGVVAEAILSYSQSTDPASPHHADQTRLYSNSGFVRLPFAPAEVAQATVATIVLD